jgi:hypothetical protein
LARFVKKAAFPALLTAVVLVFAGSFSTLAAEGMTPTRPYWYTSLDRSGALDDPHFFGQRTISNITLRSNQYIIQFVDEYYIDPDDISSTQNVLKSEIVSLLVYVSNSGRYVPCLDAKTKIATVSDQYVQLDSNNTPYLQFQTTFNTYLTIGSGRLVGPINWSDGYLDISSVQRISPRHGIQ